MIFVSAVISGFLQAQGISVPLGQLEKLFGIDMSGYFIEQVVTFFQEVTVIYYMQKILYFLGDKYRSRTKLV